jgi:hypothetical protein
VQKVHFRALGARHSLSLDLALNPTWHQLGSFLERPKKTLYQIICGKLCEDWRWWGEAFSEALGGGWQAQQAKHLPMGVPETPTCALEMAGQA